MDHHVGARASSNVRGSPKCIVYMYEVCSFIYPFSMRYLEWDSQIRYMHQPTNATEVTSFTPPTPHISGYPPKNIVRHQSTGERHFCLLSLTPASSLRDLSPNRLFFFFAAPVRRVSAGCMSRPTPECPLAAGLCLRGNDWNSASGCRFDSCGSERMSTRGPC